MKGIRAGFSYDLQLGNWFFPHHHTSAALEGYSKKGQNMPGSLPGRLKKNLKAIY